MFPRFMRKKHDDTLSFWLAGNIKNGPIQIMGDLVGEMGDPDNPFEPAQDPSEAKFIFIGFESEKKLRKLFNSPNGELAQVKEDAIIVVCHAPVELVDTTYNGRELCWLYIFQDAYVGCGKSGASRGGSFLLSMFSQLERGGYVVSPAKIPVLLTLKEEEERAFARMAEANEKIQEILDEYATFAIDPTDPESVRFGFGADGKLQ